MKGRRKQFLVLGLGRFGLSVASQLSQLGHEVLAVDSNEELVEEADRKLYRAKKKKNSVCL